MSKIISNTIRSILTATSILAFNITSFAINNHQEGSIGHGTAGAAGTGQQTGGSFQSLIFLVIIIALFYFVLIRPQMKQSKEHKKMLNEIKAGDEVLTTAGILGKVRTMGENFIDLEISNEVTVKIQKQALAKVMPKGSVKTN
jgi:preprotein translocase subunit YajC